MKEIKEQKWKMAQKYEERRRESTTLRLLSVCYEERAFQAGSEAGAAVYKSKLM